MNEIEKIINKGMNVKKFMSSWHNKVYPHVAGNILPIVSSKSEERMMET